MRNKKLSRLQTLSRAIRSDAAVGSSFPWETPYQLEPIATLKHNGANLFHIEMSPSASTRLMTRRIVDSSQPSTRNMDPTIILNRATTVLNLPTQRSSEVTLEELEAAIAKGPEVAFGDAILIATGWGDQDTDSLNSERYVLDAPYLSAAAASGLASFAASHGSNLILTDLPYLTQPGGVHAGREWASAAPWLRPSWPSANAKTYLQYYYDARKSIEDWGPTLGLLAHTHLVLGLVGCGNIGSVRLNVNIAPFQVQDVGEVPCTVVVGPWLGE